MKNIFIILIVSSFVSCATQKSISGGYWSSQNILPWGADQFIYFQDDFSYIKVHSAPNGVYWEGKWSINCDTLFVEDIYEVTKTKRELVVEIKEELSQILELALSNVSVYVRQGKVWCKIEDIDKPKKKRYILEKNKRLKKEDLINWTFRE